MLRLVLRGFRARIGRLIASALAVAIGVAFITGVSILSSEVDRSAGSIIDSALSGTDAVVRSTSAQSSAGAQVRQTVPDTMLALIEDVDGVRDAEGFVQGFGRLIGPDNRPVDPGIVPTLIFNWIPDSSLTTGRLVDGHAPESGQLVIDERTAADAHLGVGDEVRMQGAVGVETFEVAGIGSLGDGETSLGLRVVMMNTAQSQVFTGSDGQYSYITVAAADGVSDAELAAALEEALPEGIEAISGATLIAETKSQAQSGIRAASAFITGFGVIGLLVAGLTIANTFSILVAQRTREIGLLRAAGASRRQVIRLVLGEAALVGLVGAVLGIAGGWLAAFAAKRAVNGFFSVGSEPPAMSATIVAVAAVVGIGTTIAASIVPGMRAVRLPPVVALADIAVDVRPASRTRRFAGIGFLVIGAATTLACLMIGGLPYRLVVFAVGAALLLAGVVMAGPILLPPILGGAGRFVRRLGPTASWAVGDALRNPRRTTATGSALALGFAMVTAVAIGAASLKGTANDTYRDRVSADIVIDGGIANPLSGGVPESVYQQLRERDDIEFISQYRMIPAQIRTKDLGGVTGDQLILGADLPDFFSLVDMQPHAGGIGQLEVGSVGVSQRFANAQGFGLGDEITVYFPQVGDVTYRIGMIYGTDLPLTPVLLGMDDVDLITAQAFRQDAQIYIKAAPGTDLAALKTDVEAVVAELAPAASVRDLDEWVDSGIEQLDATVRVIYALLALALGIALFGVFNTISLSMTERVHEIALSRAIGCRRSQIVRKVILESALIAAFGTASGVLLGTWIGGGLLATSASITALSVTIPWLGLIGVLVGGTLSGAVAGAIPAWRAARKPIAATLAQ